MVLVRSRYVASVLLVIATAACSKSDSSSARYVEEQEEEAQPVRTPPKPYTPPPPLMTARREQMEREREREMRAAEQPETARTDAAMTVSDEQIVSILAALDERSIELAKLASARSKSQYVQNYAAMVIAHREDAQNKRQRFIDRANMAPQPSETSLTYSEDMKKDYDALKGKSGKGFNEAFVATVMENEREALQFIDDQALINVKSAELKTLIQNARSSLDSDIKATKDLKIVLDRNLDQAPKKKPAPVPPGV